MSTTRSSRTFFFVIMIGARVLTSHVGHAQTNTLESRERRARDAYAREDLERARRIYTELYAADPKPKYLWNLAIVESRGRHFLAALQHFKEYLKSSDASDKDRDDARAYLRELMARTAHIAVEATAGMRLVLDGVEMDKETPLEEPLDVQPGLHEIEGRLEGRSVRAVVVARASQLVTAHLLMDIPVDGNARSTTFRVPAENRTAPSALSAPSSSRSSMPPADAPPPPHHPTAKIVTVATIGVAALASFGARVGFGMAQSEAEQRLDELRAAHGPSGCGGSAPPSSCAEMKEQLDRVNRNTMLGNVFLATGIGLVLSAGVTWFVWPKPSRHGEARTAVLRLSPVLEPGAAGVTSSVKF